MSFINPFFLYFLPLITAPLIIHLLGKQRYKKVKFSSLRFLKALEHDVIRRLKLRQIILLILRTLLILFLILLFARPYRTGSSPGIYVSKGETIYLAVDNSSSMGEIEKGKNLLQKSIQKMVDAGNEIAFPILLKIVKSTENGTVIDVGIVNSIADIVEHLENIRVKPFWGKLDRSLEIIREDILQSREASVSIWILSDFQKSSWKTGPEILHPVEKLAKSEGVRIVFFPEKHRTDNGAVRNIEIPKQIIELGKSIVIEANVENWGGKREIPVSIFLEKERVAQDLLEIPANQIGEVKFEFIPIAGGPLSGRVGIGEDNLITDNECYFALNIPEQVNVLLVGKTIQENRLISKALNPGKNSFITIKFVSPNILPMENLEQYNVIIFSNIDKLQNSFISSLHNFLNNKKGIIVLPGSDCNEGMYNSFWADNFDLPKWNGLRNADGNSYLKIGSIKTTHPIFSNLWKQDRGLENSPHFYTVPGFITGKKHSVLMSFDDNMPMLIESDVSRGKGLLLATFPGAGWTDLQITGFFPVLFQRMVLYLAGYSDQIFEYFTRDTLSLENIITERFGKLIVESPTGRRFAASYDEQNRGIYFYDTDEPGIYKIFSEGRLLRSFAVNIPLEEQSGVFFEAEDFYELIEKYPKHITLFFDEKNREADLRVSREYFNWLIFLILMLAGFETFIGRINRTTHRKLKGR